MQVVENKLIGNKSIKAEDLADFLLDVSVFLISSGAHCGRIWRNCNRIAEYWGFSMNLNPTLTGIFITVKDENNKENTITRYKTAPSHSVHFAVLTLISHLSWNISQGEINFEEAKTELEKIKHKQNYNYWLVALAVGISCACLCIIAGGGTLDATFAFLGASIGSIARVWILKFGFNAFLSFIVASFITTLIASLDTIWKLGVAPEATLATSVLYLIPGVPLINSVIDLLEGYLAASLTRSLFAASIVTCIAVGMIFGLLAMGIVN